MTDCRPCPAGTVAPSTDVGSSGGGGRESNPPATRPDICRRRPPFFKTREWRRPDQSGHWKLVKKRRQDREQYRSVEFDRAVSKQNTNRTHGVRSEGLPVPGRTSSMAPSRGDLVKSILSGPALYRQRSVISRGRRRAVSRTSSVRLRNQRIRSGIPTKSKVKKAKAANRGKRDEQGIV
jgi:hypothetical protein